MTEVPPDVQAQLDQAEAALRDMLTVQRDMAVMGLRQFGRGVTRVALIKALSGCSNDELVALLSLALVEDAETAPTAPHSMDAAAGHSSFIVTLTGDIQPKAVASAISMIKGVRSVGRHADDNLKGTS